MDTTHVVGIDPGLVHTGVVRMLFEPDTREIRVDHAVVDGPDEKAVACWIEQHGMFAGTPATVFCEGYRPRSNLATDKRMVEAVARISAATKATVLANTAVTKVVKQDLMVLLGVWKFSTTTHHQDLRSAARIALLGMLKDETLNAVIYDVVLDHLDGLIWTVST